jgi:hypothetical protein
MPPHGVGMLPRLVVTTMLLLVLSPVTAPFATYDLADLFQVTPSSGTAAFQCKPSPEDSATSVGGSPDLQVTRRAIAWALAATLADARCAQPLQIPLRI